MASPVRAWWLLVAFLSGMVLAMFAENLILKARDNRLEFSTPYPFLSGQPALLTRLKNAAEVPFIIQTSLYQGDPHHMVRHAEDRFVVSWDLWQESFSVVRIGARKRASHLTAAQVEKWCMGQMDLDTTGISPTDPLWAKLDIRAEDPSKDSNPFGRGQINESGLSLTPLIELFSRPPRPQQVHYGPIQSGPYTLEQLRRLSGS